jgi:hypothetical protein
VNHISDPTNQYFYKLPRYSINKSAFRISILTGTQCSPSRAYSLTDPDVNPYTLELNWPCCVLANKNRVNAALIKDITIKGIIFMVLHDRMLLINKISLNRLIDGGAAILQIHRRNHHRAMEGIICIRPLHSSILREDVRSNTILVKQNIPEEHSPWAIIRARQPDAPVFLPAITPAITNLIWATEE